MRSVNVQAADQEIAALCPEGISALLSQSVVGFYIYQGGRFTYINNRAADILGLSVDDALKVDPLNLVLPEDRALVRENVAKRIDGTTASIRYRFHVVRPDGDRRLIEVHGARVEHDGRPAIASVMLDVTADETSRRQIEEKEHRLHEITSVLTEGVIVVDNNDRIAFVNPAAETILLRRADTLLGRVAHKEFHYIRPDGSPYPIFECPAHQAMRTKAVVRSALEYFVRPEGTLVPVAMAAAPIFRDGDVAGAVVGFHDVSERIAQQEKLRAAEERWRMLFNSSYDAIFVHPVPMGRFIEVNEVACHRLGYSREELLAMSPADIDDDASPTDIGSVHNSLDVRGHAIFEQVHVTKSGRRIPVEIACIASELDGRPVVISVARDITERKRAEQRIRHMAHYDQLTDLPNRHLMMDRLHQALESAARNQRKVAVLFLDLDGFKQVNDTYGHDTGDQLLRAIAKRLISCVRKADTICRIGGDEFIVVLPETTGEEGAANVAQKIISLCSQPVILGEAEISVGVSVGLSLYPDAGGDAETLVRLADDAMYEAKRRGKGTMTIAQGPGFAEASR